MNQKPCLRLNDVIDIILIMLLMVSQSMIFINIEDENYK